MPEFLPKVSKDDISGSPEKLRERFEQEQAASGDMPQQPKGLEVDALDGNRNPVSNLRQR